MWQLKKYKGPLFKSPIRVAYTFFLKGKMRQDCDNAISSINDVLQDSGIIENDNLIYEGMFKKIQNNAEWKTVISIVSIS